MSGRLIEEMVFRLGGRVISRAVLLRKPDQIIGGSERPYLMRWHLLPRNRFLNIYLHMFLRDDDDRALHDHPWVNISVLLRGRYVEHRILAGGTHVTTPRKAGDVAFRLPSIAHRIALVDGKPCWTLFVTGPRVRAWGFHCRKGWVHWQSFTDPNDTGRVGPGCGGSA